MTNLTRWSLVLAAASLMGGACGGSKLGGTGGTGGAIGYGGFFETGGFFESGGGFGTGTGGYTPDGTGGSGYGGEIWNTGGFVGTGGFIGAGGGYGTGGVPGTGGGWAPTYPDGGTCSAPIQGPVSTWDTPRPFGWTFSKGVTTGAVGSADAGAPDAGDSGVGPATCRSVPDAFPGTSCTGMATMEASSSGAVVAFADGSKLTWDGTLASALTPYVAQQAGGPADTVWVDYEERNVVVCASCGAYTTRILEIRNGQGGKVRFYDQQGDVLPNLTDAQEMDIFGATATPILDCTVPTQTITGCTSFIRSEFDHQLGSQTILDATLTEVTAPSGKFQVLWASSVESYVTMLAVNDDECTPQQQPGVASDTGFVASLLSP
jgi:hypothetical protein